MRWTNEQRENIKETYLLGRREGKSPKQIYTELSSKYRCSYRAIKSLIERMRKSDPQLKKFKSRSWTREDIINELATLYVEGDPLNRVSLPSDLRAIIENHVPPKSNTYGLYFTSFDNAIAEAIYKVGYRRDDDGNLTDSRLGSLDESRLYYRTALKRSHNWTPSDIITIFRQAQQHNLPIQPVFFEKYQDVYKNALGLNRTLKGFRQSVERQYQSWYNAMQKANVIDAQLYHQDGRPKYSTEEMVVAGYLLRNDIPFIRGSDLQPIEIEDQDINDRYSHFVPDFYILNGDDIVGIVEVFGSVQDSNAGGGLLNLIYKDKMDAKNTYYARHHADKYVAIVHSEECSDLLALEEKLSRFKKNEALEKYGSGIRAYVQAKHSPLHNIHSLPKDRYGLPYLKMKQVIVREPQLSIGKQVKAYIPNDVTLVQLIDLYNQYVELEGIKCQ